ncbi:MAG: 4Fe-4S binding protein [Spirochaetes bacterium]|nr:4Fe-4S binding protein [Spirochaetota bacterium]
MFYDQKYLKNISSLKIADPGKCPGCGRCVEVCPHNVFELKDKKVQILNRDACMECGACEMNCAYGVLEVNSGVGCASAIIYGIIKRTEPVCGCSPEGGTSSCC